MSAKMGKAGDHFQPKNTVPVSILKLTANMYPVLDNDTPIKERYHAYYTNKAALNQLTQKIPFRIISITLTCNLA